MSWWDDELEELASKVAERSGRSALSDALLRAIGPAFRDEGHPTPGHPKGESLSGAALARALKAEFRKLLVDH